MRRSIQEKVADNVRVLAAAMVEEANSGHPGGAMGGADFITVLYTDFLKYDPDDPHWYYRDRFFLDPGHMSPMLYGMFSLLGYFSMDEVANFRQWESPTHGHPEMNIARGIENTSGPLGMGHTMAVGCAIAERFYVQRFGEICAHKTFTFISDGGIQEEISQGAGRIAGHLGLGNLIMFYDSNDIQLSHFVSSATSEDVTAKYEAWGWHVVTIDGHDHEAIRMALQGAMEETDRPSLIIGKTIMGKGAVTSDGSSFERQLSTHGQPISNAGASKEMTIKNLGGDPKNPFTIFDSIKEYLMNVRAQKKSNATVFKTEMAEWEKNNTDASLKLKRMMKNQFSQVDFSLITPKSGCATRVASGEVLEHFAKVCETMVVSSADLSNSDNTGKFLDNTTEIKKNDFSGRFLQAGVAELTMGAIMNGMALHGGIIPVCGTFFVFSDYMKPAFRLAALMGLPVKYIWTHDSFRVGEDGPTHQPIEHEAQARLLEKMKNLKGRRSFLVLRPADSIETVVSWEIAIGNTNSPTALILTRQNVEDIPAINSKSRYEDACGAKKGAYILYESNSDLYDIILVANGSDVSLLLKVGYILEKDSKLNVRVISAPSEGLFRDQDQEYQNALLPFGSAIFAYSSGLPATLSGMVGAFGKSMGLERFGASAPYKVLEEKFGYTPKAVVKKVLAYLEEYKTAIERVKQL